MSSEKKVTVSIVEDQGQMRAVLPEARSFAAQPLEQPKINAKPGPTQGPFPDYEVDGYRWANWGLDDNLPSVIRKKIYDVPMAARAIMQLTQMMFGNGIAYYHNSDRQSGTKVKRHYDTKIERWMRINRIETHFLPAQFIDYRFYMNAFSELIFSQDKKAITNIYHKQAEFCRLSIQDQKTFKINYLLYAPDFQFGHYPTKDKIARLYLIDMQEQQNFLERLNGKKFAWHSKFPTPGLLYYAMPFWMGLFRDGGWLDVSRQVPEVVNAMMKNQIVLKYHVLIPETYFEIRHADWQNYTNEQRNKAIDTLLTTINDSLQGAKNAFVSIMTLFKESDMTGQQSGKIEIIAVDDKVKKDAWVPSSNAADAQIVQGLGLHPSQVGLATEGGKMGAGSGSDQRESFNTGISLNTIEQQIILEPLNWIATYNAQEDPDWDVTFYIDHTFHTTSNLQESGLQPGENTLQIVEENQDA